MTPAGTSVTVGSACPHDLRWSILQAARARDTERHEALMAEAAEIERRAAATRSRHAAAASGAERLFAGGATS